MKNLVLILCFSFIFVGCTSIKVVKDPFKNSTIITMDMDHDADIEGFMKFVYAFGGQYSREIKNGKKIPTSIIFRLNTSVNITALSSEAYIKIDNKITKLKLTDINSSTQTSTSESTQKNFSTGEKEKTTKTTTTNALVGKLVLTREIEESILKARNIHYRLYSHNDPIEMSVSASQLNKIKEFLKTTDK